MFKTYTGVVEIQERRKLINTHLSEKGFLSIAELAKLFPDVSSMTIRRDLEYLENRGEIVRTKGGAKSILHLFTQKEEGYHSREVINADLKEEIAQKMKGLIEEKSCVFFDAGSTVMRIVKELGQKPMYAVTNDPNIALELIKNPNCEINVVCGTLNRDNISLSGIGACEFLDSINIGTAVIAASGFSFEYGFTCGGYDDSLLKKKVISKAGKTIVVMDSTKLHRNHPFTFAGLAEADILVTDKNFDETIKAKIKDQGVKVV